ncbi:hypothetical protein AVEN_149165-1, partial [Araneus ventricosus]
LGSSLVALWVEGPVAPWGVFFLPAGREREDAIKKVGVKNQIDSLWEFLRRSRFHPC